MRILDIRERSVPLSRYANPAVPPGGLTTSIVAIVTDAMRGGEPVVGYGFSSIGRYAQSGLIRERFAPRLLECARELDPMRAWSVMLQGEKPGGHGERCVAIGTLDMAIWDAAAKIAGAPLYRFLAALLGREPEDPKRIRMYAGGGYRYPDDDIGRLRTEMQAFVDDGYTHAKMKIGGAPIDADLRRIEAAAEVLGGADKLAVDAMNAYDCEQSIAAAKALAPYGLWWFEDVCDPLDFETQNEVARTYEHPIAAGEALFSVEEAKLLHLYGGLRPRRDVLLFDPVHCYGIPGYLHIVQTMERSGWPRSAFWPHGGHLFTQHVVAALGLGGAEVNPSAFLPFGGNVRISDDPGIGFESYEGLFALFAQLTQ